MSYSGALLSIEGLDGSGKDTVIEHMSGILTSKGYQVEVLSPFTDSFLKEFWYESVMSDLIQINPYAETLTILAMMADVLDKKILPAMSQGKVVILNRWVDSTWVYQGMVKGVGCDVVDAIAAMILGGLNPNYTFLLDVDPVESQRRLQASGKTLDVHERAGDDFHTEVRKAFHMRIYNNLTRFLIIDANQELEVVKENVERTVETIMNILGRNCANDFRSNEFVPVSEESPYDTE